MGAFRDLSIRRKLVLVIMFTSGMALLLASVVFIGYDRYSFRQARVRSLTTLADIIGSNSAAALASNDSASTKDLLRVARAKNHIVAACIYTQDGRVLASYSPGIPHGKFQPPAVEEEGARFRNDHLLLFHKIVLGGKTIGTVYFESDLEGMQELLHRHITVVVLIWLGSSLVAYLLSSRLQQAISGPIQRLAWTAKVISIDKNYSVRAVKQSEDELGMFTEAFNEMLEQIQRRDTALLKAKEELEVRVQQRTQELQHEIAEHRQAEERVLRLAQVVENTSESVAIGDANGQIRFVNRAFLEAHGSSEGEILGKSFAVLSSPTNPPGLYEQVITQTSAGGWKGECLVRRKDGSDFPVFLSTGVIKDSEGRPVEFFGFAKDITGRKQAEKKLQERTIFLNALIENSPLAIVVADGQHRVKMCNKAFEQLFFYRQSEILGRELDQLVASEEVRAEANSFTERELAGEIVHACTQRRRKDGKLVEVEMYGVPLLVNGELVGVFGLYQDITQRRREEEELKKAEETAQAASRSKSEFLANMSHEIRTPMNGIIGMTELALDTDLNPEQREYLTLVKTSAESLLQVINDILDFSKIEAGRLDLESIEFRLRDALGETLKTLAVRAHKKGLELSCQVSAEVPECVVGDPGRLRQVVVNLVGNAIKFTERGEVVVRVSV
ncbi:MAG TPA: PAS domain S-box protein, partial [Candidatus Acidoferrales bacterium]|nr:PAS domain S-box protein [Candidatus Acidoferrales bacterium]